MRAIAAIAGFFFACSTPNPPLSTPSPGQSPENLVRIAATYLEGIGVQRNEREAVRLYRIAAEQGNDEAQIRLALLYDTGRDVPRNEAKAAEQGHSKAQLELGGLYAYGRGVDRDLVRAWMWLKLGLDADVPKARALFREVDRKLSPEQRPLAKALERDWRRRRKPSQPNGSAPGLGPD